MNAYIFQAALLCEDCADMVQEVRRAKGFHDDSPGNSDVWPQGPYPDGGGKSDSPEHCDHCGVFLENPLTEDGEAYVREYAKRPNGGGVTMTWFDFYGYLFTTDEEDN